MANTSGRMLQLLSLLQTHRFWSGSELAGRLRVSERTLRRDIDRLRELGYPVDAAPGVAGGYQLRAGTALPPLLLDDEEAVIIAVGLRTAAFSGIDGVGETSVRALAKVVQVMPPRLRRRVDALQAYIVPDAITGGPTVDAGSLTVIAQACRDDERLRFGYTTRAGDSATRLVEPHRLVTVGRRWYLVAWDIDRADWRVFRVDRLTDPSTTGARFRQRDLPGGDAAAFVRERMRALPAQHDVEVEVRSPAAEVERVVGRWGTVRSTGEGSCRLVMRADSFEWPAVVLGFVGAEFEVVRPVELRGYLDRMGQLLTRCAGAGTGQPEDTPCDCEIT